MEQPKDIIPSNEELENLSLACDKLWNLDQNYLVPFEDYELDMQGGHQAYKHDDTAKNPLFKFVKEESLQKQTFKNFISLLDNYVATCGVKEVSTNEEMCENRKFLNSVLETPVGKYLHGYLTAKKLISDNYMEFKKQVYKIWFEFYTREVMNDSSGFEHVFLGEIKNNQVIGLHNWIQIYLEEKKGNLNYKGYIPGKRNTSHQKYHPKPNGTEQLISIQFDWKGCEKMVGSSFIGCSPEFEFALYTLIFFCGHEENDLEIGGYAVKIKCFKIHGQYMGTCFPMALD